jgi:tetratricopeptide (TPR) repeat protein
LSYLEIGETDKALIDLSSVIDKMGLNSAYNNRAIAYASLGQFDLARADLSEALEKNDRYVLALINRGIVLEALGELDNAMADYDLALELDHMNPDANRNSRLLWKRIKAKQ